jgi:hypothetical protein
MFIFHVSSLVSSNFLFFQALAVSKSLRFGLAASSSGKM